MKTILLSETDLHRGPLILINRAHPLQPCAVALQTLYWKEKRIPLEARAASLLQACVRACGGAGLIVPVSGWRSHAEQMEIWNDSLAEHGRAFTESYVARPGCSEHESGLAIDLAKAAAEIDFIRPDFPCDGVCGAFRRSAADYGFIERYRAEKRPLTGIAAEPWHFRYVGAPHAVLIEKNGLCLEEYAPFLQRNGEQVCRLANGKCARVRYIPWTGAEMEICLPKSCWQISGDNAGGFILTLWE